ncbi:MAG: VOC family protein [Cyanobacteria bacterium P01_F01_bin.86]
MYNHPTLSLMVIRVSDIDRSAAFYSALGLTFKREQHGSGPEHFSTWMGETVFELYPASERFPITTSRIGFKVVSIAAVLEVWRQSGCKVISEPKETPWGLRTVVADPDGHRIELTQNS